MFDVFSAILSLAIVTASPASIQHIPLDDWQPAKGDQFIADTRTNIGYIVHENGNYTSMKIGSGQRKMVHYMRRTYNAATPSDTWQVESIDTQTDHLTFGKDGTFMRLNRDGESTSYGIHSVANIDDLLKADDRYKSMGCVLVDYKTLEILLNTYKLNGDSLKLLTIDGITTRMTPAVSPMTTSLVK